MRPGVHQTPAYPAPALRASSYGSSASRKRSFSASFRVRSVPWDIGNSILESPFRSFPSLGIKTLYCRGEFLASSQHRIPRPVDRAPDLIGYTDAALLSKRLASLALSTRRSGVIVSPPLVSSASSTRFEFPHKTNPIIGMEMLAPLALLQAAQSLLRGRSLNLDIDNKPPNTLTRGDCSGDFLAAALRSFF